MNTSENILENIGKEFTNIEEIKSKLLKPVKIQLHSGLEGYNSPETYAIYRNGGGDAIGRSVGKDFVPANLELFLETIVQSITECGANLDLSKLKYTEYKGGAKVMFTLPVKDLEVKSPMVGDVLKTRLQFSTGFDGNTKFTLSWMVYRLWCKNGCASWEQDIALAFKNTISAQFKMMLFCEEIFKAIENVEQYGKFLDELVERKVTQKEIDTFVTKVTGYDLKDYKNLTTRKRNILDKINGCIAVEMQNTGANQFSLLQGITRYTTHDLAGGSIEDILYKTNVVGLNNAAHKVLAEASLN